MAAVLRTFALLHDVKNELKGIEVPPVPGNGNSKNDGAAGGDRLQLVAGGGSREIDPSSEKGEPALSCHPATYKSNVWAYPWGDNVL